MYDPEGHLMYFIGDKDRVMSLAMFSPARPCLPWQHLSYPQG